MCLQINETISPKLVADYFPRRFRPLICAANPYTFWPCHEKEAKAYLSMAKRNKITKSFPICHKETIIIAQFSKLKVQNYGKSEQAILS